MSAVNASAPVAAGSAAGAVSFVSLPLIVALLLTIGSLPLPLLIKPITG